MLLNNNKTLNTIKVLNTNKVLNANNNLNTYQTDARQDQYVVNLNMVRTKEQKQQSTIKDVSELYGIWHLSHICPD